MNEVSIENLFNKTSDIINSLFNGNDLNKYIMLALIILIIIKKI
jgi:hypothetical protein